MSRKLPEELAPALARTGHHWPEADEDGLRRAAGLWREFGGEAERLTRRGTDSVHRVTGENSGQAVDAFAEHWTAFSGGGRGALDDAHAAAEVLAGALDKAAGAVDHCKAELVSVLTGLTDEIKQADAAEAKADTKTEHATDGLSGLVGAVVGTAQKAVAEAGESAAVAAAALKIGELLHELGREMKDAVTAAVKEPPITALERVAQADGRGLHGEHRESSAAGRAAGGALAGAAVARSVEVAGVSGLHAAVGKNGKPVIVDADGKPVHGVAGLSVAPGPDGQPVVVGADGKPVAGLALGADGKPVLGADGKPLLVGVGGALVGTGLTMMLGSDGRPKLGADGQPVLLGADGKPVAALAADAKGHLLTDTAGHSVTVGEDGHAVGPDGRTVVFDAHGKVVEVGDANGLQLGADGKPVLGADGRPLGLDGKPVGTPDGHGGLLGADGKPLLGADGRPLLGLDRHGLHAGPLSVDATAGPGGAGLGVTAGGASADLQAGPGGVSAGAQAGPVAADVQTPSGGGGGHHRGQSTPVAQQYGGGGGGGGGGYGGGDDGSYDLAPPVVHHGPASVRTDSVAVAPPQPQAAAPSGGDGWSGGGGGYRPEPAAPSGGGGSAAGGASFQLGPVGGSGGGFGGGAVPATGPVGGGFAGGATVGGPGILTAPGGAGAAGAPGGAGAGPAAGAVSGGAAGAAGAPGTPGAPGTAAGAVGVPGAPAGVGAPAAGHGGQGSAAAAVVGVGQPGQPGPAGRAPGGGSGLGQQSPAAPVRYEPVLETRRRDGLDDGGQPGGSLPVEPGQVAALWVVVQSGRSVGEVLPNGEPAGPRTIADGRPYGLPGGLGPVDPAHQAETVRRTPLPAPDPGAGDWVEALNGGGPREAGRANNSVDVALSAVDTVGGHPTCAAPRLPDGPAGERGGRDRAERELGVRFLDLGDGPDAHERLGRSLLQAGPGTRAVLLTLDAYGRSHSWNAVNHDGALSYLDHLTGYASATPLYPADHGLWAIAVDAGNRPVDLAETVQPTFAVPESAPESAPPAAPESASGAAPEPVSGAVPEPESEPVREPVPAAAPPRSRLTVHRTTGSTRR